MNTRDSALPAAAHASRWRAALRLDYRHEGARTQARHAHEGPLRVLKALYPEGEGVCHHVIVHPPGGIVGGDELAIDIGVEHGAHALLTTPGATRYYRSAGPWAVQRVQARLAEGARLEWLPMETIVHEGARAASELRFALSPGASMIGWDVVSLGLPAGAAPGFASGSLRQHLEVQGRWLERALVDALDRRLLDSPLGLAGHAVFACAWLASDDAAALQAALDAARQAIDRLGGGSASAPVPSPVTAAVTQAQPGLLVARALAHRVEPVMDLWRAIRGAWRRAAWDLDAAEPRVWST